MSLKTQPSPIFLRLKLHVVRVHKEVFGGTSRCDVDMSGHDELSVILYIDYKWSSMGVVRVIVESIEF